MVAIRTTPKNWRKSARWGNLVGARRHRDFYGAKFDEEQDFRDDPRLLSDTPHDCLFDDGVIYDGCF